MGWRGGPARRRDVVVGSTVDSVVRNADCDVLVERIGSEGAPESIVLPTAGGPHAEYAAEVTRAIAHTTGASVMVLRIVAHGESGDQAVVGVDSLEKTVELLADVPCDTRKVENPDVAQAIIDESENHDLTIIGTTREGILQQLLFGSIPEQVGREASGTLVMAKRDLGVTSRLRRLFSNGKGRFPFSPTLGRLDAVFGRIDCIVV